MDGDVWDELDMAALLRQVRLDQVSIDVVDFGVRSGFLVAGDVISIELERLESGIPLTAFESDLALRLRDDLEDVVERLRAEVDARPPSGKAASIWRFTAITILRERWTNSRDPWVELDDIVERFDLPSDYDQFTMTAHRPLLSRVPTDADRLRTLDEVLDKDRAQFGN